MKNNSLKLILPNQRTLLERNRGFAPCSRRSWSRDIKNIYNNKCVISLIEKPFIRVVSHHLYCTKHYPQYELNLMNGIPLSDTMHKKFHQDFGQKTTPLQFRQFLILLKNDKENSLATTDHFENLIQWIEFLDEAMLKGDNI